LKLRRLFGTGAAVLFKGSGFYETDYRSKAYKQSAEADRKAEAKSNESSSDKKDGESKKPADKAEKKDRPKPDKGSSAD
jgi:predicted nucleic acid-binding Zn ribbon protein